MLNTVENVRNFYDICVPFKSIGSRSRHGLRKSVNNLYSTLRRNHCRLKNCKMYPFDAGNRFNHRVPARPRRPLLPYQNNITCYTFGERRDISCSPMYRDDRVRPTVTFIRPAALDRRPADGCVRKASAACAKQQQRMYYL